MSDILLQIQNVKKHYKHRGTVVNEALKGVSFDIHRGEVLGLLGVNGAGKSTLSSIIATLHPATEGDILWQGQSIYRNLKQYRSQLGFCPQKPNLDAALTLEDNLRYAGRLYGMPEEAVDERVKALAKQFDLEQYLSYQAAALSGGYRQRFMIARSLMHRPQLVLLDEPTVGLDPHVRRQLWTFIEQLKRDGVTVILTTHYLDEAEQLSDRVCILHQGQIKLIDTPANLTSDFKKANLEEVFLALMTEEDKTKG